MDSQNNFNPAHFQILIITGGNTVDSRVADTLRDHGYKVDTVGDLPPETDLSTLPHLLILAATPGNYQLGHRLGSDPQTEHIPLIFVATAEQIVNRADPFNAGGADYLICPVEPLELLVKVQTQLQLWSVQRDLRIQATAFQNLTTRLQSELSVARDIQRGLLPPPAPPWTDLNIICYTQSAREVGGDFYTYYAFDSRLQRNIKRYAAAIGDVSGKGMPAALLMAISLASFKSLITQMYSLNKLVADMVTQTYSLGQFLADLDRDIAFYTATTRQNCALVYVEITRPNDPQKPVTLRTVNAGCMMPIIRRVDGSVLWVDVGGMPLGAGLGGQLGYREKRLSLQRGDLLILTSDGVVEAHNSRHEMLGFERLEEIVRRGPQSSVQAMLAHIKTEVAAFVGDTEPHDDQTIIVIQT